VKKHEPMKSESEREIKVDKKYEAKVKNTKDWKGIWELNNELTSKRKQL
jgi:hypothetical protein